MNTNGLRFEPRHSFKHSSLFACLAVLVAAGTLYAQTPILVLDTGGHTAPIRSMAFTKDGKYLISAGHDKEVRIWNVQTGAAVRTIRGQITTGNDGQINAIALSPDDQYLAVGGWLLDDDGEGSVIRILDFRSGETVRVLKGHENIVEGLAFSPNGKLLASAGGDGTVRLWDVVTGREREKMQGGADRVHTVAFSPDGNRIASGNVGGGLRLWQIDGDRIATLAHPGDVVAVAFDERSEYLASISEERTIRLWNPKTGTFLKEIAIGGNGVANLSFITGAGPPRLLISYFSMELGHGVCEIISVPDGERIAQFVRHEDVVMASSLSPDGQLAASAGSDHEIYLWETQSGRDIRALVGRGKSVRSIAYAPDGHSIAFGTEPYAQRQPNAHGPLKSAIWLSKDSNYRIALGGGANEADFRPSVIRNGEYSIRAVISGKYSDWATLQILRNQTVASSIVRDDTNGFAHLSFSFTPDGRSVITGGLGGTLTIHNVPNGAPQGSFVGHTGQVLSLAVSPDGLTLVSGSDDQTIRFWDIRTRRPLLTMFVGSDGEWVAWTPDGFYTSSVSGDSYVGWHLNQGRARSAKYFSAVQFQKAFYRPDIVEQHLSRLGPVQTPATANDVAKMLPPTIQVQLPPNTIERTAPITIDVSSDTLPLTAIRVFVNGAQIFFSTDQLAAQNSRRQTIKLEVPLRTGSNSVEVVATNRSASSRGEEWTIHSEKGPGDEALGGAEKGDLYVLAIGISKYGNASVPQLQFAAEDAAEVAEVLKKQEGVYFREVHTTVLRNEQATKEEIDGALTSLQESGGPNDTRVLYLAGHGSMTNESLGYHFWGFQHEASGSTRGDVSWLQIIDKLSAAPGRKVLIVDTCRAGGLTAGGVDFDRILKRSAEDNPALLVFAASTATEKSFEFTQLGHGVFTNALLKTLSLPPGGQAVREIYSDALGVSLREQVQDYLKNYCATSTDPSDPAVNAKCQQTPVHIALPVGLRAHPLFAGSP